MERPTLTVGEIFRRYGDAYRHATDRTLSMAQRRVMTAIASCRTAALGGHFEQCDRCGHTRVWYNSCRNRHCPSCQSLARAAWIEDRTADLLDCQYFHVVFTVPQAIAEIAAQNKAVVYAILFRTTAVYAKPPFAGPRQVLEYVGRYTPRVAIANQRLLDMDDGHVRFRYKNYRAAPAQTLHTMTLDATEFIRRFLLHVLPAGFLRIRYYGWLGHRHRTETLARCRHLLRTTAPPPPIAHLRPPSDHRDRYEALTGVSLRRCPHCANGQMIVTASLLRARPSPARPDTS